MIVIVIVEISLQRGLFETMALSESHTRQHQWYCKMGGGWTVAH